MKFLSENAFGVYVFHAPVLIGLSILTKDIHPGILPKFFIIGFFGNRSFTACIVADPANSARWQSIQLIIIQNECISQYTKPDFL